MQELEDGQKKYRAILDVLSEEYNLSKPYISKKNNRGLTSDNLIIRDDRDSKYFVKIYHRKRDLDLIQDIGDIKQYFASQGIPVIHSLRNKHGNKIARVGGRFLKIRPFVKDIELNFLPSEISTKSLGFMLAKIHLAGKRQTHLTKRKIERWDIKKFLKHAHHLLEKITKINNITPFDTFAVEFLKTKIKLAENCTITYEDLDLTEDTLCHGDFHYQNVFFDSNGEVSYVFDFERAMKGPRLAELARAMFFICFDWNTPALNEISDIHFERARTFLQAYHESYPFEWGDFKKGVQWAYWSELVCSTFPIEKHYQDNNTVADEWVPKRLQILKYISKNLDTIYSKVMV